MLRCLPRSDGEIPSGDRVTYFFVPCLTCGYSISLSDCVVMTGRLPRIGHCMLDIPVYGVCPFVLGRIKPPIESLCSLLLCKARIVGDFLVFVEVCDWFLFGMCA